MERQSKPEKSSWKGLAGAVGATVVGFALKKPLLEVAGLLYGWCELDRRLNPLLKHSSYQRLISTVEEPTQEHSPVALPEADPEWVERMMSQAEEVLKPSDPGS